MRRNSEQLALHSSSQCVSSRLTMSVICCLAFVTMYSQRFNLSIERLCVVRLNAESVNQSDAKNWINNQSEWCSLEEMVPNQNGGMARSSLHWGDVITQIPAGWLAWKHGGKRVLVTCIAASSLITIGTPIVLSLSAHFLIVVRLLQGICQSAIWPSVQTILSKWTPPSEYGRMAGLAHAGSHIGILFGIFIWAFINHVYLGNESIIYYVQGILGLVWVAVCVLVLSDSPLDHTRILPEEKEYILQSQAIRLAHGRKKGRTISWESILSSHPLWAIVVTHTCNILARHTYIQSLHLHVRHGLNASISEEHIILGLAHTGGLLAILLSSNIADKLSSSQYLSTTSVRKIFNSIGEMAPAILLINAGLLPQTCSMLIVSLLTVAFAVNGCVLGSGYAVNILDIAPQYAGLLFAVSNTIASIPLVVVELSGGISDYEPRRKWHIVFVVTAAISIFGAVFFAVFGTGKIQFAVLQHSGDTQTESPSEDTVKSELNKTENIAMDTLVPQMLEDEDFLSVDDEDGGSNSRRRVSFFE